MFVFIMFENCQKQPWNLNFWVPGYENNVDETVSGQGRVDEKYGKLTLRNF
jgi:hypothetical protein